jgi:integrase
MANHKWENVERGLYKDVNTGIYYQRIRRAKEKGGDTWQFLFTDKVTEARDRLEQRRLVKHASALGLKVKVRKSEPTVNTILDGFEKAGLPNISGHERMLPRYVELALPYLRKKLGTSVGSQLRQKVFDDYHTWRCAQCKKGDGDRTTDLDLMALSAAFTWAVRAELVDDNPVEGFHRFTDPRKVRHAKDVSFKSMDEVHACAGGLMKNPRGESTAWQALFATQTGQRPNELLKMRIDAEPGEPGSIVEDQLFVHRSKNPKIVNPSSCIHEGLKETIAQHREWLKKRHPKSPWYFPGRGGAKALCATALNGIMNKTWARFTNTMTRPRNRDSAPKPASAFARNTASPSWWASTNGSKSSSSRSWSNPTPGWARPSSTSSTTGSR